MVNMIALKERYESIYGIEPCEEGAIKEMEKILDTELPNDFKDIANFYSGGLLGGISHHAIACTGQATNVVQETLRLRKAIGLNNNYIVLAEPTESIIILNTAGNPAVIWCDAVDAKNINSSNYSNQPDTWMNYSEFFSYLLNEEENES